MEKNVSESETQETIESTSEGEIKFASRFWAGLGYISFLCFVPLFIKRNDDFALFHARQGLLLFVAWIFAIVASVLPVFGGIVWDIGHIGVFVFSLIGVYNASRGARQALPLVGKVSEGFEVL